VAAALLAVALLAVALALALTGAFDGGGSRPPSSRAASGRAAAPSVLSVRLLPLRVADPQGGPPWGMRLVSTTRGLLCAQVGRVAHGQLGELGVDGAFGEDGRFHPLAADQLPEVGGQGIGADGDCLAPKETFAGEIDGLDRNALSNPVGAGLALSRRREISFGLLGPHALAISYRSGARTLSSRLLGGLGAYLIVAPASQSRYLGTSDAAPGSDYTDDLAPAGLTGALVSITSRYGGTVCTYTRDASAISACRLATHPLGPERTPSRGGAGP